MTTPEPPVNVALVLVDGTRVPVDCTFEGYEDGIAMWVVQLPDRVLAEHEVVGLTADVLPAKTSINFPVGDEGADS